MAEFLITDNLTGPVNQENHHNPRLSQSILFLTPYCSEEMALIRILLGTVDIEHSRSGLKWKQSLDYSVLGTPESNILDRGGFISSLKVKGIEWEVIDKHLRSNLKQSSYYSDLCGEILYAILNEQKGTYTLAFLHIYRFLERISFAFPLVYSARSKDFKSAYSALKEFIEGGDKGELNFFKKFVETSIDVVLRDATTKIDFSSLDHPYRSKAYSTIKNFVQAEYVTSDVVNDSLEIKNVALLPLLVNIRNRFFHFLSSNPKNLTTSEIPDSDIFFSCINTCFLNWLSVIYFEVLRHSLEQ